MTTLIDDYLREVETTLRADATRRRLIVDELRSHLDEKVADEQAARPDVPRADIERDVLRGFGSARDLALGYEPEGAAVLYNKAGDTVLRLGQAVGRGAAAVGRNTGRALKWVAVALAGLLVIALGVGAWAYTEVKPYIPAIIDQSQPSYEYYERCAAPCNGATAPDTFYVHPDARSLRFDVQVHGVHPSRWEHDEHVGNGTVHVTVTDPNGTLLLDRAFAMTNEGSIRHEASWAAVPGNWTIAYRFDGFVGAVGVETYAMSFAWRE